MHLAIVQGIKEQDNCFLILDPTDKQEPIEVSFEIVRNACSFVLDIRVPRERKTYHSINIKREISENHFRVMDKNRFKQMKSFADMFEQIFDPVVEFRNCRNTELMATEKLVDDLRKLIRGIDLFVVWLSWRNIAGEDFSEAIARYKQIMSKWNVFINLLYKQSIIGWESDFKERAYANLNDIILLEKEAYKIFLDCMCNEKKKENASHEITELYSYPCDMKIYMNNSGFASDRNVEGKNLTGVGEFFVWDEPGIDLVQKEGIHYRLETGEGADNIVCRGQHIEIDCSHWVHKISIIGCAEWGQ